MLFEAYNARFLELRSVGETFVLREDAFAALAKQDNSLLVGPRGSGKTTLLKMLKIEAQIALKKKHFRIFKDIKFSPVYVNADRQFVLTTGIATSDDVNRPALDILTQALVTLRVKYAFLDTLREVTDHQTELNDMTSHHFVRMEPVKEREFCRLLGKAWAVLPDIQTITELRAHLLSQIVEINRIVMALKLGASPQDLASQIAFLSDSPMAAAVGFVGTFNDYFGQPQRQWALCVDEMEIMPRSLQNYFYEQLRSTDPRLLLKLATSPYSLALSEVSSGLDRPAGAQDYTIFDLAAPEQRSGGKFTRRLVAQLMRRQGLSPDITLEQMLGHSPVIGEGGEEGDAPYRAPNGEHYIRFRELYVTDPSFKSYIDGHGVDLSRLGQLGENARAAVVRKAIWQVALRYYFGQTHEYRVSKEIAFRSRSLKSAPPLYAGAESVVAMCEGNPRITIGIFNEVLSRFSKDEKRLASQTQSGIIETTVAKYLSFLSSIPIHQPFRGRVDASVVDLLEVVGDYLFQRNLLDEFSPQPIATLVLDDQVPEPILSAIGAAINQGAIVILDRPTRKEKDGQIRGATVRISYLLASRYKLPLTKGRDASLTTALAHRRTRKVRAIQMRDLFGGN